MKSSSDNLQFKVAAADLCFGIHNGIYQGWQVSQHKK